MAQPNAPDVDASDSWQRLRSRLDAASQPPAVERVARRHPRRAGFGGMQWLIAAMVVQAIGLGALGAAWWSRPSAPAPMPAGAYRTLSAPEAAVPAATIRVVFAPELTMAQLRAVLSATRLQVLAGPNEVGVFTLGPAGDSNRAATEAALRELRASPQVRFAEGIASAP